MRLIDLDKIDVFHQEDEDVVFDIIHATPVDAIPIKWIEKYAEYLAKTNPHEYDTRGMQHEYLGISLMVKDWNL